MSKFRKIALIILFILVITIVSILLYRIFFKTADPVIVTDPSGIEGGGLPAINEGDVSVRGLEGDIVTDPIDAEDIFVEQEGVDNIAQGGFTNSKELVAKNIKSPDFSKINNGLVYYDRENQGFYRVNDDGSVFKMSENKFYSVVDVVWSPTKNQALIEYPEDDNVVYNKVLYDFDKDRAITSFQKEMKDFNFSNNGEKISAKWIGDYEDHNYIVSSDIHGNNFKFVEPIGSKRKDVQTVWSPDSEILATYRESVDANRQEVYFINENNKNLSSLIVDGRGFEVAWNPKGDKILYSVFKAQTDYNPTLWIASGQGNGLGGGKRYVGLNTWVDKCDFSQNNGDIVYCAVPDYLPKGSGWYPELAKDVPYHIYQVDISTGRKQKVADPVVNGSRVNIDQIYLGENDQTLYYTNGADGHLYSINLATE
jgi:hypothetical protein